MKRIRVHIEDGQVTKSSHSLRKVISKLDDGEYAIEVKTWSGWKTWQQIKAVKGVIIPAYVEHTGYTFEEAQRRLKKNYGVVEYGELDGQPCIEFKSFASYSSRQMREFIDGVLEHMEHDLGIIMSLEEKKKLHINYETGELEELK